MRVSRFCFLFVSGKRMEDRINAADKVLLSSLRIINFGAMKSHRLRRKSVAIPNARWAGYAAAGVATSLLGLPAAEAEIHYSGILNHGFTGKNFFSSATFPLNNGAHLLFRHVSYRGNGAADLAIPRPGGGVFDSIGAFVGDLVHYGGFYLSNLASRVNLSQLQFKNSCHFTSTNGSHSNCYGGSIGRGGAVNGNFQQPGKGIIGFVFDAGAGPQYGWARIKTTGEPNYRFILLDYAWGDPGDAILTGQKHGPAQGARPVSKSGSLGLLALGGAGLLAWRKRRSVRIGGR